MEATSIGGNGPGPSSRLRAPGRRLGEKAIERLLALCGFLSVVTTTAIVIALVGPTLGFFDKVSVSDFLFGSDWTPTFSPPSFGVLGIVVGTLSVTLWAMVFAIPMGLASAIYLSEYANPGVRKVIKPILEILAGIPTVAIGFFAASFLIPHVIRPIWPGDFLGGASSPFMAATSFTADLRRKARSAATSAGASRRLISYWLLLNSWLAANVSSPSSESISVSLRTIPEGSACGPTV